MDLYAGREHFDRSVLPACLRARRSRRSPPDLPANRSVQSYGSNSSTGRMSMPSDVYRALGSMQTTARRLIEG